MLPLADFGTVNFTGATVDGAPIGNRANLSEVTMSSAAGTVLAAPSALTSAGAFSVTAQTGGTTTAAPSPGTGAGTRLPGRRQAPPPPRLGLGLGILGIHRSGGRIAPKG